MKFPQKYNLVDYRFPTEGKNYISVPGEALTMKCKWDFLSNYWEVSEFEAVASWGLLSDCW